MAPSGRARRVWMRAKPLARLITLAIDHETPIVVQTDGTDAGVITRADLLRTVIEGTEVS